MADIYIVISKYVLMILMAIYTWECFSALKNRTEERKNRIFGRQNFIIYATYMIGVIVVFINNQSDTTIILAGAQLVYLVIVLGIFPIIYPTISRALLSNMCMLLTTGFIVLARLNYEKSIKQFAIVAVATLFSLIVPYLMSKYKVWKKLTWAYCFVGIGLLIIVLLLGFTSFGSRLSIQIGTVSVQPSEFVKIIYVFFLAGLLAEEPDFKKIVQSAFLAGTFVIILVLSRDLGSALIFFMVYSFMLYAATKKKRYLFLCAFGGSFAAVVAAKLFSHVQVRIAAWRDPWSIIDDKGYQITQSLFAICSGGYLGTGLYQGSPKKIPVVEKDFVFSAIAEEFGGLFAMLLILVCLSCYIAFVKIAMQQISMFNRLVAFGLAVAYAVQVFLTIGGAIKMIPSTGVTLPLVSYGGSSILSTLIIFAIIQGLAIVGTENTKKPRIRRQRKEGAIE